MEVVISLLIILCIAYINNKQRNKLEKQENNSIKISNKQNKSDSILKSIKTSNVFLLILDIFWAALVITTLIPIDFIRDTIAAFLSVLCWIVAPINILAIPIIFIKLIIDKISYNCIEDDCVNQTLKKSNAIYTLLFIINIGFIYYFITTFGKSFG